MSSESSSRGGKNPPQSGDKNDPREGGQNPAGRRNEFLGSYESRWEREPSHDDYEARLRASIRAEEAAKVNERRPRKSPTGVRWR
jgi:hypothetical protein